MTGFYGLLALFTIPGRSYISQYIFQTIPGAVDSDDDISVDGFKEFFDSNIQHITFVSSNKMKIREVKMILGDSLPWELKCVNIELDELQATPIAISQSKCRQAALACGGPVLVEDTSLCFNALNGLPGPYIKWFYESVGNHGLTKLLDGFEDKSAYAQCVLSFCWGLDKEIKTFVGSVDGTIVPPTGPQGFGWDPIFIPLGQNRTFADMDRAEKSQLSHRFKAFRQFQAYINQRTGS